MWKIKKLIKSLDSARGVGTPMASLILPPKRLKLYHRVPPNGLVLFVGTILTDEGKEKKVSFDFEPHKPVNTSLYLYDKFHTEALSEHSARGQSALRFSRLRDEKRRNYVREVAVLAVQHFITNDEVNVTGLVLAGSADFKTEPSRSDMFDLRLAAKVVDVSYGGRAIKLAAKSLANVKFVQEKRICFGIEDTLKALELGAVETLIVWGNLDITRYILRNASGEDIIVYHNKEQDKDRSNFIDRSTGLEIEQSEEPQALLEWFAEKYKEFGANLEFVTNRSQEGAFGFGGLVRYKADFTNLASMDEEDEDEFYSDDDDI
ncbi:50S ribosomal protein L30e-like protein [Desarmillaria tabescens]|uniref:50S ribosomal protein L30e-like protein n=1 Tax=Armillaria tabescens TaxID=1929756 RepID=A0AA39KC85_ARMTA|nr:50S ribosomal protein L30e-like protein [Desarmillaria tabescens]KAK0458496.1 50S ribosomal protein L30e-like protein [Desarmillaria tabescens]